MELAKNILIVMLLLICLYILMNWIFSSGTSLSDTEKGDKRQQIEASTLDNPASQNFTYSIWFFMSEFINTPNEKILLTRKIGDDAPSSINITLGTSNNDLTVSVNNNIDKTVITNYPIQKWVNLFVSVFNRTLDCYINGKLVQTTIMSSLATVNKTAPVIITPGGGFPGFTANIKYWGNSSNPQDAYNTYKDGFGGSILGNLFNKFRIKIAFLQDNKESGSFEI